MASSPEHPSLIHNVVPTPGGLQFFSQQPMELRPHLNYPLRHFPYVALPLGEKRGIVEDRRDL